MSFKDEVLALDVCHHVTEWIGNKTYTEARDQCPQADWGVYFLSIKAGISQFPPFNNLVKAALSCVGRSFRLLDLSNSAVKTCIISIQQWCDSPSEGHKIALKQTIQPVKDYSATLNNCHSTNSAFALIRLAESVVASRPASHRLITNAISLAVESIACSENNPESKRISEHEEMCNIFRSIM